MQSKSLYVSELSTTWHVFSNYHFCRGNNNKRKTRIGLIIKGSGTYLYLNKKLNVAEGDVVFVPESIYCYSEWYGSPEIEVMYVSCFLHFEKFRYEPQIICCTDITKHNILEISRLLTMGSFEELEAYSLYYKVLQDVLPSMVQSEISEDKTLRIAMEYIMDNWDQHFYISDVAKKCCVSESTLYHLFQKELGQTPISFLNGIRINQAIQFLENSDYSISTISQLTCFRSENHFRKVFTNITGTTPLKFRKST